MPRRIRGLVNMSQEARDSMRRNANILAEYGGEEAFDIADRVSNMMDEGYNYHQACAFVAGEYFVRANSEIAGWMERETKARGR